jgi:hypothetical protein
MPRILVTDAVGLVGAYIIRALLEFPEFQVGHEGSTSSRAESVILAGYHSSAELEAARKENAVPGIIQPVLVDWAVEGPYSAAARSADAVLLLTPFTADKVNQTESWPAAIVTRNHQKKVHVVQVGIHTTDSPSARTTRPAHETWQLEAEAHIRQMSTAHPRLTWTFLRLNFDGYNTLLRPGRVAYYIAKAVRYGWMARHARSRRKRSVWRIWLPRRRG